MSGNLSNSVFISYRRSVSAILALAVYQDLSYNQIDAFYDITSLDAGQFDTAILNQIAARPYFLPILTPGTLERCVESGDWVLREIEEALRLNRMIVPLYTSEFDFGDMDNYLPPEMARELKRFQAVEIPYKYFQYAMQDIRTRYLKPIDRPIAPTPVSDVSIIGQKQALAQVQPPVTETQLSAQEYFERAYIKDEEGDYGGAIADLTEAIRLNPTYALAYNNRGISLAQKGDLDGAILDYTTAVQLNPLLATGYNNRGTARHEQGDFDSAIADYTTAVRLNPQFAEAYNNRGNAYRHKGEFALAIADFTRSIDFGNPDLHLPLRNRGLAYFSLDDLDTAVTDFDQAIQFNPQFVSAYLNRGVAYERLGDPRKAADDYQQVLKLQPDHPQAEAMQAFVRQHG